MNTDKDKVKEAFRVIRDAAGSVGDTLDYAEAYYMCLDAMSVIGKSLLHIQGEYRAVVEDESKRRLANVMKERCTLCHKQRWEHDVRRGGHNFRAEELKVPR